MQTYKAPLRDMRFVLHELHGDTRITDLSGCMTSNRTETPCPS
jgi:hypothetical protein